MAVWLSLLAGCGRTGFDPIAGDAADAAPSTMWALVQTRSTTNASTVMDASGSGNLIVVAVETAAGAATSVTDDAGNVYTPIVGGRGVDTGENLGIELWFVADSKPGATRITATAPTVWATALWEVAGISTTAPLAMASQLDDQVATTSPRGASITTTVPGELVISVAIVANVVSGLTATSAFTNDHLSYGNGWAHLTSASAPPDTYAAEWTQPTIGTYCAASASFRPGS